MDDWGAGSLLRDLVAEEPPPSRIDGRRAISGARRRRKLRRARFLTAGMVVALAGVVAVVLPVVRDDTAKIIAATAEQNLSPNHVFDPKRFQLALDSRPDGVVAVEQESALTYQRLTLLRKGFKPIATISVYGTGQVMPGDSTPKNPIVTERTDSVYGNGVSSHWRPAKVTPNRNGRLLWFWGPNAWAFVDVYDSSEPLELALRLARALRTDQSTAVRMPLTAPVPAGTNLLSTATMSGPDGVYAAELRFAPALNWILDRWVAVAATNEPTAVAAGLPYDMADSVTDYAAPNSTEKDSAEARPTGRDLVTVVPVTIGKDKKGLIDAVGAKKAASTVKLVADPGDPKNWARI